MDLQTARTYVARWLTGEISEDEQHELNQFLKENPEFREKVEKYGKLWKAKPDQREQIINKLTSSSSTGGEGEESVAPSSSEETDLADSGPPSPSRSTNRSSGDKPDGPSPKRERKKPASKRKTSDRGDDSGDTVRTEGPVRSRSDRDGGRRSRGRTRRGRSEEDEGGGWLWKGIGVAAVLLIAGIGGYVYVTGSGSGNASSSPTGEKTKKNGSAENKAASSEQSDAGKSEQSDAGKVQSASTDIDSASPPPSSDSSSSSSDQKAGKNTEQETEQTEEK